MNRSVSGTDHCSSQGSHHVAPLCRPHEVQQCIAEGSKRLWRMPRVHLVPVLFMVTSRT